MAPVPDKLQNQLKVGLPCLPNKARRKQYAKRLQKQFPQHQRTIKRATRCYTRGRSVRRSQQCLTHVLGRPKPLLSAQAQKLYKQQLLLCKKISSYGETAVNGKLFKHHLLHKAQVIGKVFQYNLILKAQKAKYTIPAKHLGPIHDVTKFYAGQLKFALPSLLQSFLKTRPDLAKRWRAYQARKVTPTRLNPPAPKRPKEWIRKDLVITGLSYKVPVYFPKHSRQAWPQYETRLRTGLEVLKMYLAPKDFDALLCSPTKSYPDMSFYVADLKDRIKTYCSKYHCAGSFTFKTRRLAIRSLAIQLFDPSSRVNPSSPADPLDYLTAPFFLRTFYHEIGHALYKTFLRTAQTNNVFTLWAWAYKKNIIQSRKRTPAKYAYVPQPTLNIVVNGRGNEGLSTYALKDVDEYFASWVAETIVHDLESQSPAPFTSSPVKARMSVMKSLLSPNGINLKALSAANIYKTYLKFGLSLADTRLGPSDPPVRPRLQTRPVVIPKKTLVIRKPIKTTLRPKPSANASRWVLPIEAGYRALQYRVDSATLLLHGVSMGIQTGYMHAVTPTLLVGGGVLFDFATASGNEMDNEVIKKFDVGAWAKIEIPLKHFSLSLGPTLALQHLRISGRGRVSSHYYNIKNNAIAAGLDIGLSFFQGLFAITGRLSFSPRYFDTPAANNFGVNFSMDIAEAIRKAR